MKDGKLTLPLESEKDNNSISDNEYSVFDADGYWLCDVRGEDHAKTIVRAVNSHDALVEALEGLEKIVSLVQFNMYDGLGWLRGPVFDAQVKARAALAKAKEA